MNKQPWFKFWAADYICNRDVQNLSLEAQGLLVRMWCICHIDGSLPADEEELSILLRCKRQCVSQCYWQCKPFFELRGDRLISPRMEREKAKSELARKNSQVRYNKPTYKIGTANGTANGTPQKARISESQKKEKKDPRFAEFVELSKRYWEANHPNGGFTFAPRDGKQAKDFLNRFHDRSISTFKDWFNNMLQSDNVNTAWLPFEFIPQLHKYADAPLDTFGRSKTDD